MFLRRVYYLNLGRLCLLTSMLRNGGHDASPPVKPRLTAHGLRFTTCSRVFWFPWTMPGCYQEKPWNALRTLSARQPHLAFSLLWWSGAQETRNNNECVPIKTGNDKTRQDKTRHLQHDNFDKCHKTYQIVHHLIVRISSGQSKVKAWKSRKKRYHSNHNQLNSLYCISHHLIIYIYIRSVWIIRKIYIRFKIIYIFYNIYQI